MDDERVEWYPYRRDRRLAAAGLRWGLVAVFLGVPLLIFLLGWGQWGFLQLTLIFLLPVLFFAGIPALGLLVTTADLGVGISGIRIAIFGPWEATVKWEELKHAAVWTVRPPAHVGLLLRRRWDEVYAVYVPGLDVLAPVGMYLGLGRMPVFVITPDHDRYQVILKRLEHVHHPLKDVKREQKPRRWRSPRR